MPDITNELKEKLLAAKSREEVSALLKAAGEDVSIAEQVWNELSAHRADKELSLDELDAVSGGDHSLFYIHDWWKVGCAATVEPDSSCASNDGCSYVYYRYKNIGTGNMRCPADPRMPHDFCQRTTVDWTNPPRGYYWLCQRCGQWILV